MEHLSKKLFVIESPGKIESFNKILSSFLPKGSYKVMATYGRLFDLPVDSLGIDNESFKPSSWDPIHTRNIDSISTISKDYDHLYLCTDNDLEGELIADQIKNISNSKHVSRVYFNQIEKSHLEEAINNATDLSVDNVNKVTKRRVMDRIVGYTLSERENNNFINVGRVITPTLGLMKSTDFKSHAFNIELGDYKLSFEVDKPSPTFIDQLTVAVNNEDKTLTAVEDVIIEDSEQVPFDYSMAINAMVNSMDVDIEEAAMILQKSYEEGRLSYPRTDSSDLNAEDIKTIARQASFFGVDDFSSDRLIKRIENGNEQYKPLKQGAHSALMPTDMKSVPLHLPFHRITNKEEQALYLITRNLLDSGSDRTVEIRTAKLNADSNLKKLLDVNGVNFKITSKTVKVGHKVKINNADEVVSGVNRKAKKDDSVSISENDFGLHVFNLMVDHNIGRPSTWVKQAKKIIEEYTYKGTNDLNRKANNQLRYAEDSFRDLAEPDAYEKMELSLKDGLDFKSAIYSAMESIGVSREDLERRMINKGFKEVSREIQRSNESGGYTPEF